MASAAQPDVVPYRPSVLIVEDDPDALDLLATILEDADYEVVRASTACRRSPPWRSGADDAT
jgi:DNA-binding response OmpR family regulator